MAAPMDRVSSLVTAVAAADATMLTSGHPLMEEVRQVVALVSKDMDLAGRCAAKMKADAEWLCRPLVALAPEAKRQVLRRLAVAAARALLPSHASCRWFEELSPAEREEAGSAPRVVSGASGAGRAEDAAVPAISPVAVVGVAVAGGGGGAIEGMDDGESEATQRAGFRDVVDALAAVLPEVPLHSDSWESYWLTLLDIAVSGHYARWVLNDREFAWKSLHVVMGDNSPISGHDKVPLPREATSDTRLLAPLELAACLLMHAQTPQTAALRVGAPDLVPKHEQYRPVSLLASRPPGSVGDGSAAGGAGGPAGVAGRAEDATGAADDPYALDDTLYAGIPLLRVHANTNTLLESEVLYIEVLLLSSQALALVVPLCAVLPRWSVGNPGVLELVAHAVRSYVCRLCDTATPHLHESTVSAGWLLWDAMEARADTPECLTEFAMGCIGLTQLPQSGVLSRIKHVWEHQQHALFPWLRDCTERFVEFALLRRDDGSMAHPNVLAYLRNMHGQPLVEALAGVIMTNEMRDTFMVRFFEFERLVAPDGKAKARTLAFPDHVLEDFDSNSCHFKARVVFDPDEPPERVPFVRYWVEHRNPYCDAATVRVYLRPNYDRADVCHDMPGWSTEREGTTFRVEQYKSHIVYEAPRNKPGLLDAPAFWWWWEPDDKVPPLRPVAEWPEGTHRFMRHKSLRVLVSAWVDARERRRQLAPPRSGNDLFAVWRGAPRHALAEVCAQLGIPGGFAKAPRLNVRHGKVDAAFPKEGDAAPEKMCPTCTVRNDGDAGQCAVCGGAL